jgi:hypothetical protein
MCKDRDRLNINLEPNLDGVISLTVQLESFREHSWMTCSGLENSSEQVPNGFELPPLLLKAPQPGLVLASENLPYGDPIPASTVFGVALPGGLASRTTLATPLSPARVLISYERQLMQAGWSKVQGGSTPLAEWSEWELLDARGQKWLGTLNIGHHEAYSGVVMPILIVLQKP